MDFKVLWEAVKEPLREAVLAAIPAILAYVGTIQAPWAVGLYFVLRLVDSYLHENQKALPVKKQEEGFGKLQGLTGF
jgi:hypothetical protein